jgi:hypothetical protein
MTTREQFSAVVLVFIGWLALVLLNMTTADSLVQTMREILLCALTFKATMSQPPGPPPPPSAPAPITPNP